MFEFELDPIDPQLDFQEVVASLVSTAEGVIAEHPELRNALTPDDGAYEEAIRVRAACQRVLRLFEDASEKLPEQAVISASEELKTLFLSSKSREAPGKLVFAARTLHSAYQNRANAADNLQWRVAQLQSECEKLRGARDADATLLQRLLEEKKRDQRRIRQLVKLGEQQTESRRFVELQAEALRRKRPARSPRLASTV